MRASTTVPIAVITRITTVRASIAVAAWRPSEPTSRPALDRTCVPLMRSAAVASPLAAPLGPGQEDPDRDVDLGLDRAGKGRQPVLHRGKDLGSAGPDGLDLELQRIGADVPKRHVQVSGAHHVQDAPLPSGVIGDGYDRRSLA